MASSTHTLLLLLLLLLVSIFSSSCSVTSAQNDTLKQGQLLRDYEQLVSAGGTFRLGFFSPNPTSGMTMGSAGPRYLGIWFEQIPFYPVWVANRDSPVPDSSGALVLGSDGNLKITYQNGPSVLVNSKIQTGNYSTGNITATLLDSGNLVLRKMGPRGIAGPVLWQSFDYPHNILLPGMKLGMNLKTGQNWSLTSWLSEKVPASGAFRLGVDPSGTNQLLVWRRGEIYWSSGAWLQNGSFQSAPGLTERHDILDFKFVSNDDEKYFSYSVKDKSVSSRWDLDTLGQTTSLIVDKRGVNDGWIFTTVGPCNYGVYNSSSVCLTEKPVKCRKNGSDFFAKKRGYLVVGEFWSYNPDASLGPSDCHALCWKNCSCIAYQSYIPSEGSGCQFWVKGAQFTANEEMDFVYLLSK